MPKLNQKGVIHYALLIAAIGVIAFLGITSFAPFKDQLLGSIFPKSASEAATQIPRYGVFETTLTYTTTNLTNPWEQVTVSAVFTSPSSKTLNIDGFYYDTDTYKVRFTPAELGTYNYTINVSGPNGNLAPITGSFDSVASSNKGFIRKQPGTNRFVFEDGSFFNGVGFNQCFTKIESALPNMVAYIGNAAAEPAGEGGQVPIDDYFRKYAIDGGFNLFRWNPGNCSFGLGESINTTGNTYSVNLGKGGDTLLSAAKSNGFHILFTNWLGNPPFAADADFATNTAKQDAVKRAIRYYIARYGAYVDMWEIGNENSSGSFAPIVPDSYLTFASNYIRSIDPYKRLITNSNERPNDAAIGLDMHSPHLYGQTWDFYDKPSNANFNVMLGEVGRGSADTSYTPQYTATMRMADWTGVFGGTGVIYWNIPSMTTGVNQYIGSKERLHNKILANTTADLNGNSQSARITNLTETNKFGYKLTGADTFAAYIYDNRLTNSGNTTTSFSANIPFSGTGKWIDPKTGNVLSTFNVSSGTQTLTTPTFTEDIALKITTVAPSPTPSFSGSLSLSPASGTFNRGCTYQVAINYDTGGSQSDGIDAVIFYDQNKMIVNSVTNGTTFSSYPGSSPVTNRIMVSGISGAPPAPGVTGSGTLGTLNISIPSNAPLGSATLNFDFDSNNPSKTTDSNIVVRGLVVDALRSVINGNYQIDSGTCSGSAPVSAPVDPSNAPSKQGDLDGDNDVDIFDYNALLTDFGKTGSNLPSDLDKNGVVDIFDYNILLTNFGQ